MVGEKQDALPAVHVGLRLADRLGWQDPRGAASDRLQRLLGPRSNGQRDPTGEVRWLVFSPEARCSIAVRECFVIAALKQPDRVKIGISFVGRFVGFNAFSALSACSAKPPLPTRRAYDHFSSNRPQVFISSNVDSPSLTARRRRCSISEPIGFNKCFRRAVPISVVVRSRCLH